MRKSETHGEILATTNYDPRKVFWKTPNNHDTNAESDASALHCYDTSLTKQEFKDEADINKIMERFLQTGQVNNLVLPEHFQDITGKLTYEQISQRLADANQTFYKLDASIRDEFGNSPAKWADQVMKRLAKGDQEGLAEIGVEATISKLQEPTTPPGGAPAPGPSEEPSKGSKGP